MEVNGQASYPGHFIARKTPQYPLYVRLDRPQNWYG